MMSYNYVMPPMMFPRVASNSLKLCSIYLATQFIFVLSIPYHYCFTHETLHYYHDYFAHVP